ncbi:MAG: hypothetical protein HYV26_14930, partial [Candidatus Hydrogenedentes bacterium]|nr:hypothetical protein [Candidatus Hydrogenedentota bacterium]
MKQRILVIHTGGIGDLLLAFPALAELGREGEMDIAGRPERAALAVAWGLAARALDLDTLDFASVFS